MNNWFHFKILSVFLEKDWRSVILYSVVLYDFLNLINCISKSKFHVLIYSKCQSPLHIKLHILKIFFLKDSAGHFSSNSTISILTHTSCHIQMGGDHWHTESQKQSYFITADTKSLKGEVMYSLIRHPGGRKCPRWFS